MRKLFLLLLFLIIFNSCLAMFSIYFPHADERGNIHEDINSTFDISENKTFYEIGGALDVISGGEGLAILGIGVVVAVGLGWALKSTVFIAVALFTTFFSLIWYSTYNMLTKVSPDNITIPAIFTLISILIGCLVAFTIIDMFSGQGAME